MKYDFSGQRVLVTGASRGIGYAIARAFARAGADVTVLAEAESVFDAAAALSDAAQRNVNAILCDVTDRSAMREKVGVLKRLDVLVANAGTGDINAITDPLSVADDTFDRLIRINLTGTYNSVRAAVPLLGKGARIIITSSVHGQSIAPPGMSAYAASKAGVEALMRSLARELGPAGINVNAVAPGMVATELTLGAVRKLFAAQSGSADSGATEADMIRQLNAGQAIHNLPVDVDELAAAYLFLASPGGHAITGQTLNVDHGLQFN